MKNAWSPTRKSWNLSNRADKSDSDQLQSTKAASKYYSNCIINYVRSYTEGKMGKKSGKKMIIPLLKY